MGHSREFDGNCGGIRHLVYLKKGKKDIMYRIVSQEGEKMFVNEHLAADYIVNTFWCEYSKSLFDEWVNILLDMRQGDDVWSGDIAVYYE